MGIGAKSSLWRRFLLRSFAEIYLRRRGATPAGVFEVYVSGGSSLKMFDPRGLPIDPVHLAFIRDWVKPDSVVWDIGANLGLFAFSSALIAKRGSVFAFEPDDDVARSISRSVNLPANRGLHISVMSMAVSDQDGTAEFEVSSHGTAMSRLKGEGPWHTVKARAVRSVATRKIDTLAEGLPLPSIIKIDVEGAEMKVLEGGRKTIGQSRPVMLIEGPRELWDALGAFLREHDYVMLDGAGDKTELLTHPVWDTVAVPAEHYSYNA
jgi:FkbM family methyltransferase